MLDDILDYVEHIRERPVWQPAPEEVRTRFHGDLPQTTLGLDYAGIDFGLRATGEILLFEANATMVVNPPDPGERWAYAVLASSVSMLPRGPC